MELTALGLLVLGLLLAEPVSRTLAAAHWPARDPVGALLMWQAVGLAGGLSLLGAGIVYGLAPFGPTLIPAVGGFSRAVGEGRVLDDLGAGNTVALVATLLLGARLFFVLASVTVRTLRARARHRDLLDVLATPWPAVPGTRVLDHPIPVAYCLPGRSSRLVVSAGVLERLAPEGVRAVLAHERAHLTERHDLVVLPFVAWGATAPFVRGMVRAQLAVAALIEMRADDVAASRSTQRELAGALRTVGGSAPTAALSSFTSAVDARIARIAAPPPPPSTAFRVSVRLAAVALVAVPTVLLLHF
ncbi:integral membrane protein [Pseudonocardia sulfidoxydans NBRC 16205]|uniref:Integral membrane protein n=1 Tax=Pseudonocardia sulfidoxydans NBRC 16205 TaxID=1223511 RepID=A0A511D964_9PSEU|nr:M56 family metallopeptidase [Pseudonocardia sulfidoxydans]GEL21316.1 integral membrane protein [Pseudonocardia sulfidoxydans NBRC 16205]